MALTVPLALTLNPTLTWPQADKKRLVSSKSRRHDKDQRRERGKGTILQITWGGGLAMIWRLIAPASAVPVA